MEYWEMVTINLSATGAKEAVARLRQFLAADGINLNRPTLTRLLHKRSAMRTGTRCKRR